MKGHPLTNRAIAYVAYQAMGHRGLQYFHNNLDVVCKKRDIKWCFAHRNLICVKGPTYTTGCYLVDISIVNTTSPAWCTHDDLHEGGYYDDIITASQMATLGRLYHIRDNTR